MNGLATIQNMQKKKNIIVRNADKKIKYDCCRIVLLIALYDRTDRTIVAIAIAMAVVVVVILIGSLSLSLPLPLLLPLLLFLLYFYPVSE